eukprot:2710311-Amphidinium_carterae.2
MPATLTGVVSAWQWLNALGRFGSVAGSAVAQELNVLWHHLLIAKATSMSAVGGRRSCLPSPVKSLVLPVGSECRGGGQRWSVRAAGARLGRGSAD